MRRFILALVVALMYLTLTVPALAQLAPIPGVYELTWTRVYYPDGGGEPVVDGGTQSLTLTDQFIHLCATPFTIEGPPGGQPYWCVGASGGFDTASNGAGLWQQYTLLEAALQVEQGYRGTTAWESITGSLVRVLPPLAVVITTPREGALIRGPVRVTAQADGTEGETIFTLSVDGTPVASQTVAAGSATFTWRPRRSVDRGAHTLTVTVEDATGNTGSASITVRLRR
jgi:hypothetical protein